jgi:hypothetical protein
MAKAKKRARRGRKSASSDGGGEEQAQEQGPEFPKRMVKLTAGPGNSVVTDVQEAGDADAESQLTEAGYKELELEEEERPSYPAWRYSSDGGRRIVNSEEEEDQLEGEWSDSPTESAQPVDTDLARAKAVLGDDFAEKLNAQADAALGNPRAAKRADGNFDPATVPIAQGDTSEQRDAKVTASRSTESARTGARR